MLHINPTLLIRVRRTTKFMLWVCVALELDNARHTVILCQCWSFTPCFNPFQFTSTNYARVALLNDLAPGSGLLFRAWLCQRILLTFFLLAEVLCTIKQCATYKEDCSYTTCRDAADCTTRKAVTLGRVGRFRSRRRRSRRFHC